MGISELLQMVFLVPRYEPTLSWFPIQKKFHEEYFDTTIESVGIPTLQWKQGKDKEFQDKIKRQYISAKVGEDLPEDPLSQSFRPRTVYTRFIG